MKLTDEMWKLHKEQQRALAKVADQKDLSLVTTVSEFNKTVEEGFFHADFGGRVIFTWVRAVGCDEPRTKNGTYPCPVRGYAELMLLQAIAEARGVTVAQAEVSFLQGTDVVKLRVVVGADYSELEQGLKKGHRLLTEFGETEFQSPRVSGGETEWK